MAIVLEGGVVLKECVFLICLIVIIKDKSLRNKLIIRTICYLSLFYITFTTDYDFLLNYLGIRLF